MNETAPETLLPAGVTSWVLGSGRAGHQSHCLGVARALGLDPVIRPVRTSGLFSALSPFGPIDPRDDPARPASPLAPPFPDIAIASGRKTVPYLRRLRAAARGQTFTVFMEDPVVGASLADLIWAPEHDRLRGDNVIVTPTTHSGSRIFSMASVQSAAFVSLKACSSCSRLSAGSGAPTNSKA